MGGGGGRGQDVVQRKSLREKADRPEQWTHSDFAATADSSVSILSAVLFSTSSITFLPSPVLGTIR